MSPPENEVSFFANTAALPRQPAAQSRGRHHLSIRSDVGEDAVPRRSRGTGLSHLGLLIYHEACRKVHKREHEVDDCINRAR